jgi:hypothetical protein
MENIVRLKFKKNSSVIHLVLENKTLTIIDSSGKVELTKEHILSPLYDKCPNVRFYKDKRRYVFASNISDYQFKRHTNQIVNDNEEELECWLSPRSISMVMKLIDKL